MILFEGLRNIKELSAGISEVKDGNMSFVWGENNEVLEDRKKLFNNFGFDIKRAVTTRISDSTKIIEVSEKDLGKGVFELETAIPGDGLITKQPNITLFTIIADCSPVIIFDQNNKVLALLHVNYKNPKIIDVAFNKFIKEYKSNPKNIIASIGPSIQKESNQILDPIQKQDLAWKDYLKDLANGKTEIDMVGYIQNKISDYLPAKNIFVSPIDTYASTNLFSHRRANEKNEKNGRFIALAKIM